MRSSFISERLSLDFISALQNDDIAALRLVPKSDLHNHGIYGGSREFTAKRLGAKLDFPSVYGGISGMIRWADANIKPHYQSYQGVLLFFESAFTQAAADGVAVLEMSLDARYPGLYGRSAEEMARDICRLHIETARHIEFRLELGLNRMYAVEELSRLLDECLETGLFKSVDLYGDEAARPAGEFREIFSSAGRSGLKLKAHAGESGTADDVVRAVEELNLSSVQHGIAAAASKEAMKFLAERRIALNVCPESNISLGYSSDYALHQIRVLFDHGVRVTVNTDDALLFGSGVSEQFLALYQSGAFSAEE
ncbi:MAG: adenosine deaminase, partial [Candidatus Wallbacteria bacterium]|nr:adenosine deaminase [Candidatus Wallbacteria bacterium]